MAKEKQNLRKLRIGVALSAGGAKGIAHVGALKALFDAGIKPSIISGASMGSIVGALCALGKNPDEMIEILNDFDESVIKDITKIKLSLDGIMSSERMRELLFNLFDSKSFEDLDIPFSCIAYNLNTQEPVVFDRGLLLDAVQASSSIPGFFPPCIIDGQKYVDGGVYDPLPVDLIRDKCDFLIAIAIPFNYEKIKLRINPPLIQTLAKSISAMANRLYQLTIKAYKPDFVVDLHELTEFNTFQFEKKDKIFRIGENAVKSYIPQIQSKIQMKKKELQLFGKLS